MTIQWFPGHMQETELFLKKAVSDVDVVMEILDARLPSSSANPLIDKICKSVLRIKVLNKKDLADPKLTQLWIDYLNSINVSDSRCQAIAITGTDSVDTWRVIELALSTLDDLKVRLPNSRRLRVMVAGIPNSGKSTIMNTLAGKKVAKIGNVPAITKHQQRTSLKNKIDIYDTPGVLPPILESEERAFRLAASGAISDVAIDYNDVAIFSIKYLIKKYPDAIKNRYGIENDDISDSIEVIKKIGSKRGCLKKGGVVDLQKASKLIIRELRSGKIGRITFESPEDFS
ncbi:MAG: ribosome biogenesis GTPase YlqF [Desulfamplus sp.]|nr:ribosome biogenesis GTPase YlqF [Desulfamplus sp.]MBF0388474.1 ribosome biogenesis GTPase YlqF [Desulfamplus sp.]